MTTVKQLIEYLKTLPAETIVETSEMAGVYDLYARSVDLDIGPYSDTMEYYDFTDKKDINSSYYGKTVLVIGDI